MLPEPTVRFNYAIQVRWAESDLPLLETDPLIPGQTPITRERTFTTTETKTEKETATRMENETGIQTITKSNSENDSSGNGVSDENFDDTSDSSDSMDSESGNSGLSPGIIAGISAGAAVISGILGTAILFWCKNRNSTRFVRNGMEVSSRGGSMIVSTTIKPEMVESAPSQPGHPPMLSQECFTRGPVELPGLAIQQRAELPQ